MIAALSLTLGLIAPATIKAPEKLEYSIVLNGKIAGQEVDLYYSDGRVDCSFEFNDRGRGPKIRALYHFGSDGLPKSIAISGVSYFKAPVAEQFKLEKGVSTWRGASEKGSGKAGFFLSQNGSAIEQAFLAKLLAKSKSKPVALLPGGTARLEEVTSTTITAKGKKLKVRLVAIHGIGYTPNEFWIDDKGRFFGVPGGWGGQIRKGWESSMAPLYAIQTRKGEAREVATAKRMAHHPKGTVAIEHVRVFDSVSATTQDDQTVLINGGKIAQVGPSVTIKIPAGSEKIDGRGKTLLPGLFDMHVHAGTGDGVFHMASGVTSVRDMGNKIDEVEKVQSAWDKGTAIGPRIWKAGFIDGRGPFQAPTGLYADTEEEALKAVNLYADKGFVQIKVYSSLNPAFVPAIAAEAHRRGLRLSGHVPNGMIAQEFVEQGADELQHVNFVFLNFLKDQVKDTRSTGRFTGPGEHAGSVDLDSQSVKDFIRLLAERKTTVDLTLAVFESMYLARPGKASPDMVPILSRLPVQAQRGAYGGGLPAEGDLTAKHEGAYAAFLKMTKLMFDGGVQILAGTDALAGLMLHRELELQVRAGIPPAKSLQIATLNAATVLKQESTLGSIERGKKADLYLVAGDPTKKISDIRRGRLVFKGGVKYDCTALYQTIGIAPAP